MNIGESIIRLEKRISVIEQFLKIEPDKDLLVHPKSASQAISAAKAREAKEGEIKK